MSVEAIINRIPEPRAVQDLVAAARTLEREVDDLRVLLIRLRRTNYDPGPVLIADIESAINQEWMR